jgi:hypothetical protein
MAAIRKLKKPMSLIDGRRLNILGDAAEFVTGLPERRKSRDHWRYTEQLLAKAQQPMATESAIDAFVSQLTFALTVDGLL